MASDQQIECILCGGSAELRYNKYPGYQEPETFKIYHCPQCNTAFSSPRIETTSVYENIYENGDSVPGYDRYWKYAQSVKNISTPLDYLSESEETYWGVREALSTFAENKESTKILEIGSGLGYLTYSLIKAKYDVVGLDISPTAVKQATKTFGGHYICDDLFQYAQLHSESFDIVILTEVIEHIDKPLDFIGSIITLLKPRGRAIITTPNKSFYPKDIIWATELPPVHCWWFSEDTMKYISSRIKTNITFINFSKYYKKKYLTVDMKLLNNIQLQKPFFNKNGELIIQSTLANKSLKSFIWMHLAKIPFIKNMYGKIKKILDPEIIVCNDRGIVMCAILQKS